LLTIMNTLVSQTTPVMIAFPALCSLLGVFVLYRFGLLAALSAYFVYHLLVFYPMTTELSAWYARTSSPAPRSPSRWFCMAFTSRSASKKYSLPRRSMNEVVARRLRAVGAT